MTSRCHDFHRGHLSRASRSPSLTPKSQAGRGGVAGAGTPPYEGADALLVLPFTRAKGSDHEGVSSSS